MVIKRVTEESIWPKQPFPGVKALNYSTDDLAKDFEDILKEVL